jgi:hypothetical protein
MVAATTDIENGLGVEGEESEASVVKASSGAAAAAAAAAADDEGTADWYSLYCIHLAVVADGIAIGIIVPYR